MIVLHLVHIALFRTSDWARAAMAPNLARWRQDLVFTHAATLVFALVLALAVSPLSRTRAARFLAPVCALGYLVHGAATAGVDQLSTASVTVFIGYSLGVAVVVALTPVATLIVYAGGLASFVVAIETMQSSPTARLVVLSQRVFRPPPCRSRYRSSSSRHDGATSRNDSRSASSAASSRA